MKKGYQGFCEYINGKSVALIGIGISNLPLVSFLKKAGATEIIVRDLKKDKSSAEIQKAERDGAQTFLGKDYLENLEEDVIIRSPGIRPDIPPFLKALKKGSRITCETELFLEFAPCRTFAITGSDGKTTTTTLTAKILEKDGKKVHLGGNIGKAMLPQLSDIEMNDVAVLELSSFQLMNCRFSPDVAVITNLSENHLDWHRDMCEYLDAKKNILRHQGHGGRCVLNWNNAHTRSCGYMGDATYFSIDEAVRFDDEIDHAIFYQNGVIYEKTPTVTFPLFSSSEIKLPGRHNIENFMTAIAATRPYVSIDSVISVANSFGGVEHRIEFVREFDGVKYYNSSIDSSPARSTACLRAFDQKIVMIAGGYDKNLDYSSLGDEICKSVRLLILCGATKDKIRTATVSSPLYSDGNPKIIECKNFEDTVKEARLNSKQGDVVVLSPASASFDLFRNFEERGRFFKKLVMEL